MKIKLIILVPIGGIVMLLGFQLTAQDTPETEVESFGQEEDVEYAKDVWSALEEFRLVGEDRIQAFPYEGNEPHGTLLQTFTTKVEVKGHSGEVWVKNNYAGEKLSKTDVLTEPAKHLGAITVMFKREEGYDANHQDWYWAKYLPDGSLDKSPWGAPLAGRVFLH